MAVTLPYTLTVPWVRRSGTSTATWQTTAPAEILTVDSPRALELTVANTPSLDLHVVDIAIGGFPREDFIALLEGARLKIQNADGSRTFVEGLFSAIGGTAEPYQIAVTAEQAAAIQGYGRGAANSLRLRFEVNRVPVDVSIRASLPAPAATVRAEAADPTAVDASIRASLPAPTATVQAEAVALPVDVSIRASLLGPEAFISADVVTHDPVDASIRASLPAPTATVRAEAADPTAVDASIRASLPAPAARVSAEAAALPVDVSIRASLPAPAARVSAEAAALPVDASIRAALPAPSVRAPRVEVVTVFPRDVSIRASLPAPAATVRADTASIELFYEETVRGLSPPVFGGEPLRVVTCVEITHPEADAPIRLVDDGEDLVIDGVTYLAARFEAQTVGDGGQRAPRGQLLIGNVGRQVSRWIEDAGGGAGGQARVMDVLVFGGEGTVEWELTMDIASIATEENVQLGLGFDPLLGRPAVAMRYDPQTAPGLF